MTSEGPRPSAATVFDPALQLSDVERTNRIMYCPDTQVLGWFVTTACPDHTDGYRRLGDAMRWQCTSCDRYLGEWMFTKTDFEAALAHIVSSPETILFDPLSLNDWIRAVRQREREVAAPRLARAVAMRAMMDDEGECAPSREAAPTRPVDNSRAAGTLSGLSTTAGDGDRGIRQFLGLKVLRHRWRRALEIMGFRG